MTKRNKPRLKVMASRIKLKNLTLFLSTAQVPEVTIEAYLARIAKYSHASSYSMVSPHSPDLALVAGCDPPAEIHFLPLFFLNAPPF